MNIMEWTNLIIGNKVCVLDVNDKLSLGVDGIYINGQKIDPKALNWIIFQEYKINYEQKIA